jgi:4a-hydroxytetrahydrobiopterin dehydratase
MPAEEARALLAELDSHCEFSRDGRALSRRITFSLAMAFLDRLAQIAEREAHHPDLSLRRWKPISLELTSHAIGGLSRNDFVLAATLEAAIKQPSET